MNIGDNILLNVSVDGLPIGTKATIYGIYPTHFPGIFENNMRIDGMLKISTYGYERYTNKSTHYNTYIHSKNVIKAVRCNKCNKYKTIDNECNQCNGKNNEELLRRHKMYVEMMKNM